LIFSFFFKSFDIFFFHHFDIFLTSFNASNEFGKNKIDKYYQ